MSESVNGVYWNWWYEKKLDAVDSSHFKPMIATLNSLFLIVVASLRISKSSKTVKTNFQISVECFKLIDINLFFLLISRLLTKVFLVAIFYELTPCSKLFRSIFQLLCVYLWQQNPKKIFSSKVHNAHLVTRSHLAFIWNAHFSANNNKNNDDGDRKKCEWCKKRKDWKNQRVLNALWMRNLLSLRGSQNLGRKRNVIFWL